MRTIVIFVIGLVAVAALATSSCGKAAFCEGDAPDGYVCLDDIEASAPAAEAQSLRRRHPSRLFPDDPNRRNLVSPEVEQCSGCWSETQQNDASLLRCEGCCHDFGTGCFCWHSCREVLKVVDGEGRAGKQHGDLSSPIADPEAPWNQ